MVEEAYERDLKSASKILRSVREAILIFHDDADGLCAGAIASLALDRIKVKHRLICVEKLSPEIIELIHSQRAELYLYLDIGSGRADLIAEKLERSGGLVIIADHHDPAEAKHENLLHLNPELYGYSGETDSSGSTATYLLMRSSCELMDAAWLAVVGSAEIPGALRSLNRLALEDAVKAGDVEVKGDGGGERYVITFLKKPWDKISSALTAIGSIGYYEEGPYEAVRSLKSRRFPADLAKRFQELRRKRFAQATAIISRRGLQVDGMVQWFHLGDMFRGLGAKSVGTLTSILSYRRVADPKKYLMGFMNFEPEIPGLGRIRGSWVKVSVRAPKPLAKLIQDEVMPSISDLAIRAAERVGGSADGHRFAASGLIPAGRESDFIREFNRLIDELKPG